MHAIVKTVDNLESLIDGLPTTRTVSLGDAKREARSAILRARKSIDDSSEHERLTAYRSDVADKVIEAAATVANAVRSAMRQEASSNPAFK